jgi:purine-binding chemotaxis protein CheW
MSDSNRSIAPGPGILVNGIAREQSWDDEPRDRDSDELQLAGFYIGGQLYGIDIMRIKEVIQSRPYPVRPVPHAPSIVEGVIQLRGVVIPVIDLRTRFGVVADPSLERLNKLVIVSVRGRIVGLKVDRILGELRVHPDSVRPAPSMLREGDHSGFFSGVCRVEGDMVFVCNLEALIDPSRGREDVPPAADVPEVG